MGVTIETVAAQQGPVSRAAEDAILSAKVDAMVQAAIRKHEQGIKLEIASAADNGARYMDARVQDVLSTVRAEIASSASGKVMHVKVDDLPQRELSQPASPYLGECLELIRAGQKSGKPINIMLVGPRGCGKTTTMRQVAESFGVPFAAYNCSAGISERHFLGFDSPSGWKDAAFCINYEKPSCTGIDELDAADPNVTMVFQNALDNGEFYNYNAARTFKRHLEAIIMAGANTFGLGGDSSYTARMRQDAAFLERWTIVNVDYNRKLEETLCPSEELREKLWAARAKLQELRSEHTISTRWFERAYHLERAGIAMPRIIGHLTAAWGPELAKQSGILEKKTKPSKAPQGDTEQF